MSSSLVLISLVLQQEIVSSFPHWLLASATVVLFVSSRRVMTVRVLFSGTGRPGSCRASMACKVLFSEEAESYAASYKEVRFSGTVVSARVDINGEAKAPAISATSVKARILWKRSVLKRNVTRILHKEMSD